LEFCLGFDFVLEFEFEFEFVFVFEFDSHFDFDLYQIVVLKDKEDNHDEYLGLKDLNKDKIQGFAHSKGCEVWGMVCRLAYSCNSEFGCLRILVELSRLHFLNCRDFEVGDNLVVLVVFHLATVACNE
jgi:hypothetical protein